MEEKIKRGNAKVILHPDQETSKNVKKEIGKLIYLPEQFEDPPKETK